MRNTGNHEYSLWVQHYGDSDSGSESDHTYDLPPSENLSEDVPVSIYTNAVILQASCSRKPYT